MLVCYQSLCNNFNYLYMDQVPFLTVSVVSSLIYTDLVSVIVSFIKINYNSVNLNLAPFKWEMIT